jgi:hypothetical protein
VSEMMPNTCLENWKKTIPTQAIFNWRHLARNGCVEANLHELSAPDLRSFSRFTTPYQLLCWMRYGAVIMKYDFTEVSERAIVAFLKCYFNFPFRATCPVKHFLLHLIAIMIWSHGYRTRGYSLCRVYTFFLLERPHKSKRSCTKIQLLQTVKI